MHFCSLYYLFIFWFYEWKKRPSLHYFKQKINVELINAIEWVPCLLDRTVATTSIQFFIYFVSHFNDAPGILCFFFVVLSSVLYHSPSLDRSPIEWNLLIFLCTEIRSDAIKASWNKRMDGNKWRKIYTINYEYTHRTSGFSKILPLRVDTQTKQNEYFNAVNKNPTRAEREGRKRQREKKRTHTHKTAHTEVFSLFV